MPSKIVTLPDTEPVSLVQAKLHLRVDTTADDLLISSLIVAARQYAEQVTWRALVTQTWTAVFDRFPAPRIGASVSSWTGPQWGVMPGPITMAGIDGKTGYEFYLPKPPLVTVDSLKYIDTDGVQQTLAADQYIVDSTSEPGRVTPAYGLTWPATRDQINAVELTFTCGYGTDASVPEGIKRWMLLRIGAMYDQRGEITAERGVTPTSLPFVDGLLDIYRVKTF